VPPSTRQLEIKYLRIQTIFAVVSTISTSILSGAAIYVGIQLNESNDHQRLIEKKQELSIQLKERTLRCAEVISNLGTMTRSVDDVTEEDRRRIATAVNGACAGTRLQLSLPEPQGLLDGLLGVFDQEQLRKGYRVYREVCPTCDHRDNNSLAQPKSTSTP
jgi:cytochrome c1